MSDATAPRCRRYRQLGRYARAVVVAALSASLPFRPADRILAALDAVWWSAALAAGIARDAGPLPLVIVLFFIGAFVMRGAGCTWNDITDRDLDARVERTRSRPIPAGQVSVPQALAFLVLQALIGLAVLLQFNRFAVVTGIASLIIVAVYPFMKRDHLVAAGRAGPCLLVGRADGVCSHPRSGST
jgi:4-hydroxybenzoate polyprenyltransferase